MLLKQQDQTANHAGNGWTDVYVAANKGTAAELTSSTTYYIFSSASFKYNDLMNPSASLSIQYWEKYILEVEWELAIDNVNSYTFSGFLI